MAKRIGSWLLTLAMILALLPAGVVPVMAADPPYTIVFISDGLEFDTKTVNDVNGTVTAPHPDPSKTGYTFVGWCTDEGTTSIYDFESTINRSFSLYAKWKITTYTVTFKDGSTELTDLKQYVDYYNAISPPAAPTKSGYEFAAWYQNDKLTTPYHFGDYVTEDLTLYAKWNKIHTVTFSANGGTGTMADGKTTGSYTLPACAFTAPSGKEFDHWEIGSAQYHAGDTVTISADTTVKAVWRNLTYTVKFDLQGHGTDISTQRVENEGKVTEPAAPTETGYTFGGWYKEAACTSAWAFATDTVTKNTTLYAEWSQNKYTVTFDSDGGSAVTALTEQLYGATISKPADPTRSGYVFGGWYKENTYRNEWDFATDRVTDDLTLYAKWQFAVTFDADGGTPAPATQLVDQNGKVTEPDAMTKAGHSFQGWYYYQDASTEKKWNFSSDTVTKNTALYAKWSQNIYTVTFSDGGTTIDSKTVVHGGKATRPESDPTKAKNLFVNWYRDSGLLSLYDFDTPITANTTIYAKWTPNVYRVTFAANSNEAQGTMPTQEIEKNATENLRKNAFTRSKFAFDGWTTAADGTGDSYADEAAFHATEDTTLYARWTQDIFTVTFIANEGWGTMAEQAIKKETATALSANAFTRTSYVFTGWNTAADGGGTDYTDKQVVTLSGGDLVLYAQWELNTFAVTFDANGGTGTMAAQTLTKNKAAALEANKFTRTGFAFVGWNTAADGSGRAYADEEEVTANAPFTLYAQWKKTCSVTFNAKGALGKMDKQTIPESTATKLKKCAFTREGYDFKGWSTYVGAVNVDYADEAEITLTGDVTLYAVWSREVTVRFNSNGGEGAMAAQTFTIGLANALSENAFVREGCSFKCWNTAADGTGTDYADKQEVTLKEGFTLYAIWSPCVTFHANDGTDSKLVQMLRGGEANALTLNRYTRKGFVFKCWNTAANGSGTDYTDGQSVVPEGDLELYAVWTAGHYTVHFDGNGASGSMSDQTFTYGTAQALSANTFRRDGRTFRGWSLAIGGDIAFTDKQSAKDLTDKNGGVVTLYAVWNLEPGTSRVRIQRGNDIFESMTAKDGDPYEFKVFSGFYNVVLQTDKKTVTTLVEVKDGVPVTGPAAILPETASSVLTLKQGAPDVLVGNLDVAANDNRVQGADVELKLTVESRTGTEGGEEQQAIRRVSPSDKTLDFIDFTLTKTVNGKEDESFRRETKDNLILMIPFKKAATRDITVYRYHNGTVDALTADAQQGEYIKVSGDMVTVYARKFSTYAICYTPIAADTAYSDCPRNHTCPITPFDDTNPMSWYHDGVHWALDTGAMQGVSPRRFYPNNTTDRGQFVTILWRLEGSPSNSGRSVFADVPDDAWYAQAICWASGAGIVDGVSPHYFNPGGTLTREQLATILYRYLRYKGARGVYAETTGLGDFRDASQVNGWARNAMDWMATYGIFDGTTNSAGERFLMPQGSATRAQTATVMMRTWTEFMN